MAMAALAVGLLGIVIPAALASAHGASCTVTTADAAVDAQEQQFLTLINQHRVANGRSRLAISTAATRAASWFSWDMAVDNYLPGNHVDTNGRDIASRLTWCGVNWSAFAENIYAGAETAQAAFDWWKNSAVHNTNMLSTAVNRIGIARRFSSNSAFGWHWTIDLVTESASNPIIAGFTWYSDGSSTKTGGVGTTVRAYATGALNGAGYQLVLATSDCGAIVAVLNPNVRMSSNSGLIGTTAGNIPSGVPPGTYEVCFKRTSEVTSSTAAAPVTFTVS
jgi:uncharacterized protein YkwD